MVDPVDEAVGRRQVTRLLCLSSGAGERRVKHQSRYSIQAKSYRANTVAQSKISHTAKVLSNQRWLNERPRLEEKRASIGLYKGNRLSRKTGKVLRKKKGRPYPHLLVVHTHNSVFNISRVRRSRLSEMIPILRNKVGFSLTRWTWLQTHNFEPQSSFVSSALFRDQAAGTTRPYTRAARD